MLKRHTASTPLAIGAMALGLLAACEREPIVAEPAGSEPADAPASPRADAATPRLSPGLWRVVTTTDGREDASLMCIDDALQTQMSVLGAQGAAGACQQTALEPHPGGGWSMQSRCNMGPGGEMVSQSVVTGDLKSAYRSQTVVTTTGAAVAHMNRTTAQVSDARLDGPCPADMKPGDIEMAGGMRINMLEMAAQAAQMGAP